jgi:hypothetical protein
MADAPAYTNYQLSATTLATMKEAAGNYMPDYGNWRYINPPVKEEEEDEEPPVKPPEEPPVKPPEDDTKTGSDSDTWGDEGTEGEIGEVLTESEEYKNEAKMSEEAWKEFLANETAEERQARYKREVERGVRAESTGGTPDTRGGVHRTYDIDPTTGEYINIVDDYYGADAPEGYTPFEKRSPYKMHEGEPHPNTGVRPGSFADPLPGIELKNARQAIIDRGSVSSTHYHAQAKEIVKDIKANMFQQGEDEKTKKDNRTKSHVTLNTLSTGIQNLFGPEGAVENFIGLYDEGNISKGFLNERVMAQVLKGDPDVRLGVTPENNIVLQLPTPEGEMMAISASDINDFSEKAVTQHAFGAKVASGYSALVDAGRSGKPFDENAVAIESKRLVSDLKPTQKASVAGDDYIITPEPLMKHAGETYWADADVDHWELIHETMRTEEGENNLDELMVEAMVNIARDKHAMGFAEFQKENKPTANMSLEQKKAFYQNESNLA